ncbi:Error-prone DNA polymerase [subsurface metagenome]
MGKKKVDVMARQKVKFLKGAAAKGYSSAQTEKIFELLVPFAGYGFNKSHAAAYSLLAYQTAYLKANYPAEFMAANLTNEINSTDKLSEYISEARAMGLEVLPPDINLSEQDFTVRDGKIVYGLRGIKNVGSAAVDHILEERNSGGEFKDLLGFLKRLDLKTVNRKVVETLIRCGVFDSLGATRACLLNNLDRILETVNGYKEIQKYGQTTLFDPLEIEEAPLTLDPYEEWPVLEMLTHEKQNLGFYFSGHPLACGGNRDQPAGFDSLCTTISGSKDFDRIYPVLHGLSGRLRPGEDGLSGSQDPHHHQEHHPASRTARGGSGYHSNPGK